MSLQQSVTALEKHLEGDKSPAPEAEEKEIQSDGDSATGETAQADDVEEIEASTDEDGQEPEESESEVVEDLYEVTINGQTRKVNLEELKANFSKGEDYLKKSEEVANERKAIESEKRAALEARTKLIAEYEFVEQLLAQPAMPHDQLMQLRETDFEQYQRVKDDEQQRANALNQLRQQKQEHQKAYNEEAQKAMSKYLADEMQKLVVDLPEFKPAEKAKMDSTEAWKRMEKYLTGYGYDNKSVNEITDHRFIKIIEKARKFDELMAKKPTVDKKAENAPKVLKGASARIGKGEQKAKAQQSRVEKLRKTGRMEDAAAALMAHV